MDLRYLICSPDGRVSESKLWTNIGKAVAVYLLLTNASTIVAHWEVVATLLGAVIAPELFKKHLAMKARRNSGGAGEAG